MRIKASIRILFLVILEANINEQSSKESIC